MGDPITVDYSPNASEAKGFRYNYSFPGKSLKKKITIRYFKGGLVATLYDFLGSLPTRLLKLFIFNTKIERGGGGGGG